MILEHKDAASGEKPSGVDAEEWNKTVNRYNDAVKAKADLDQLLYQAFINISEHIMFQMNMVSQAFSNLDPSHFSTAEI